MASDLTRLVGRALDYTVPIFVIALAAFLFLIAPELDAEPEPCTPQTTEVPDA